MAEGNLEAEVERMKEEAQVQELELEKLAYLVKEMEYQLEEALMHSELEQLCTLEQLRK